MRSIYLHFSVFLISPNYTTGKVYIKKIHFALNSRYTAPGSYLQLLSPSITLSLSSSKAILGFRIGRARLGVL
jgi:hypothetical protein